MCKPAATATATPWAARSRPTCRCWPTPRASRRTFAPWSGACKAAGTSKTRRARTWPPAPRWWLPNNAVCCGTPHRRPCNECRCNEPPKRSGPSAADTRERSAAARAGGKRARAPAETLGLSEGAAVAAHAGEHGHPLKAQPLQGSWLELLQSLEACGPLMALTRNEGTVHEKTGVYTHVSATGPVGIALGEDIDLRLFFAQWHAGFAVTELANDPAKPPSRSLQFYNAQGRAVHKIFTRDATDLAAF